jgi:lipopolysaccharide/colanic/teichoic acid biosynthesis glycosyltransferase
MTTEVPSWRVHWGKRLFDIALSATLLVLLLPLMLVIAVVVRARLGAPVIFRQIRTGRGLVKFELVKFRTMVHDPSTWISDDSDRMTRVGQILRRWSLDELPQLWNILRGDMSFVGPRPLLPHYASLYTPTQIRRHQVRPGLTGWAQIRGRNAVPWGCRLAMDVWYVDNQSALLDLKILWKTIGVVIRRIGISEPGSPTMSEFTGAPDVAEGCGDYD